MFSEFITKWFVLGKRAAAGEIGKSPKRLKGKETEIMEAGKEVQSENELQEKEAAND